MEIKYHEMWNHSTSTIDVPNEYKYPFGKSVDGDGDGKNPMIRMTSLEILQSVLHSEENQNEYLAVDDYISGKSKSNNSNTNSIIPKCLLPDIQGTQNLAEEIMKERQRQTAKKKRNNQRTKEGNRLLVRRRQNKLTEEQKLLSNQLLLSLPILNGEFFYYVSIQFNSIRFVLFCSVLF